MFKFLLTLTLISTNILLTKDYTDIAKKIKEAAHTDSTAWTRLAYFCDNFGHRLSGSENLELAIDWIESQMIKDNLSNVKKEPVMVPKWVRNSAKAMLTSPWRYDMPVLTIGGSIATPPEGLKAKIIAVKNKAELESKKSEIKGNIVFYNFPFTNYGETVQYRLYGADWAAQFGAVASFIRSVSPHVNAHAHTGTLVYSDTIRKIPHCAISLDAADVIQRIVDRGDSPEIYLKLDATFHGESLSHNVMGEIIGSELPNEIVAAGGHIDSWDVGQGAHDDAGPSFAVWKALLLLKKLGLTPKRTIRCVMWTNEENGLKGGTNYAEMHKDEKHFGALEFDSGVFRPEAIGFSGDKELLEKYQNAANDALKILDPNLAVLEGGGGADIGPLMKQGVPGLALRVDSENEYWLYHHSHTDTVDKVNPKVLNDCIAALALALYIYADL